MNLSNYLNVIVFITGIAVVVQGLFSLVNHRKKKVRALSAVIYLFIAENLIDEIATLILSANNVYRDLIGMEHINSVPDVVAIPLRFLIFAGSGYAIYKADKLEESDFEEQVQIKAQLNLLLQLRQGEIAVSRLKEVSGVEDI